MTYYSPVNVPIPTIFKNNIDQFLHKNNDKSSSDVLNTNQSLPELPSTGDSDLSNAIQMLDDDCMYLGKPQEYDIDGMEAFCLATNPEGPIQIYRNNDVEFMMEERLEGDVKPKDIHVDYGNDVKHKICDKIQKYENVCRLCAETKPKDRELIDLFGPSETTAAALVNINKLLPKEVSRHYYFRSDYLLARV